MVCATCSVASRDAELRREPWAKCLSVRLKMIPFDLRLLRVDA